MNEYLGDLAAGQIGGVSLVDAAGSFLLAAPPSYQSFMQRIRDVVIWFFSSIPDLSGWIRDTPAVMALAAIFFFGCCVAFFMRIYHSIL